jgi:hypothetical protein
VGRALSVAYAPDGQTLVAGCWDGSIHLWEVATGRELRQFAGHKGWVKAIALSPDGKMLASVGKETEARLWDVGTGQELRRLVGHDRSIFTICFISYWLAVMTKSDDWTLRLWDATTGQELRRFGKWQDTSRKAVQVSPDGKGLVTSGWEDELRVWDLATDKELTRFGAVRSFLAHVTFSPDSKTLAIVHNRIIYLLSVGSSKEPRRLEIPDREEEPSLLIFSPDGRTLATGGGHCPIRVWELMTRQERCHFVRPDSGEFCLAFSPDGKVLASGSTDLSVLLWDLTCRMQNGRLPPLDLSPAEIQNLWTELADSSAAKAYGALWQLVAGAKQSVPFLQQQLHPARLADPQRTAQLLADLENSQFAMRARAAQELEKLREAVGPALYKALEGGPTLEVRRRVEALLDKLVDPTPPLRRELRAVEVLERIGTAEARRLLETVASGASQARLTQEAQQSLHRLARRFATAP